MPQKTNTKKHKRKSDPGKNIAFSLIELVLAIALFSMLGVAFLKSLDYNNKILTINKARIGAMALGDRYIEKAKALKWSDLGVQSGNPPGTLPASEDKTLSGKNYHIENQVFWRDDPKDGTGASDTDGNTHDLKVYKITISWTLRGKSYSFSRISYFYAPF